MMELNNARQLVGNVARRAGIKAHTLRFYEKAGLMPRPSRTAGGYRAYSPEAVERLQFIRKAQAVGLTLGQIKRILNLRESGEPPCQYVIDLAEQRLAEAERELAELKKFCEALRGYVRRWKRTINPKVCSTKKLCNLIEELDLDLASLGKPRRGFPWPGKQSSAKSQRAAEFIMAERTQ